MAIAFFIGVVLLGGAMFFYGTRHRRLSCAERDKGNAAARANWGKEEVH